ncbi:MAG: preprotein translocase subunit SecG [Verrucomicrobiota bacterium]
MVFVIGFLTVVLVLDCLFLILLVLMQLPKKEAGAGLAFGGAATDALFGAGSGNFLTKATKYAAIGFFVLTVLVSVLQNQYAHRSDSELRRLLEKTQAPAAAPATEPSAPASAAAVSYSSNSTTLLPLSSGSSVTNTAPKK